MKKIILSAIAAAFIAGPASAVQLPAEGESCASIHDQVSRLNPTDLSDFQKCVAIEFDKDSGFLAGNKTFWVRTGTEFTYFQTSDLAKVNSEERVEMIKETIIKEVIVEKIITEIEERIIVDNTEIERLRGLIAANESIIETIEMQLADKTAHVKALDKLYDHAVKNVNGWYKEAQRLEGVVADLETTRNALAGRIEILENGIVTAYNEGFSNRTIMHIRAKAAAREAAMNIDTDGLTIIVPASDFNAASAVTEARNTRQHINGFVRVTVKGETFTAAHLAGNESIAALVSDISTAAGRGFQKGYEHGFNDGYDQGYKDGYVDGFRDGVESVAL